MKVILYRPQIPQNTGNIVRTCKVTETELVLVRPLGFKTDDKSLKRAGLDYWNGAKVSEIDDLPIYLESATSPFYFFSSHAKQCYASLSFPKDAILIFGSEDAGLPKLYHEKWPNQFATLPMAKDSRCLNLSTAAGIVVYEAWRQNNFTF